MDLSTLETRKQKLAIDAKAMLDAASKEGRGLSDDETKQYDTLFKELEHVDKSIVKLKGDQSFYQKLDEITQGKVEQRIEQHVDKRLTRKSFGDEVIAHKAFKDVIELAKRSRRFESDLIEVKAAPILEASLVPAESLGQIAPGPTQMLPVAALFAQGTTSSNSVTYNRESSYTIAAAAVAEGAVKPESEIVLTPIVEPVRKYAHWITISKEALEDIAGIRSFIDSRLRYGLALKIDNALLNGSATPPSLVGLLNRTLGTTVVQGVAPDTAVDAILRQVAALQTASGLPADGIVMHPADWTQLLGSKDSQGQYYGNGPFASQTPPTLWGKPVAVTTAIAENTALVGAFKTGAQLLWRETMVVSVSNSHESYFVKNLLAVLIEARLSLIVTMPEAFGKVTLLP